jgi:hypothetical protein
LAGVADGLADSTYVSDLRGASDNVLAFFNLEFLDAIKVHLQPALFAFHRCLPEADPQRAPKRIVAASQGTLKLALRSTPSQNSQKKLP